MDPFGVISFVLDNAERLKSALDQVRANDEAIESLTLQTATSLEDLEDIFKGLCAPAHSGQIVPAGLQKDLDRMKDSMVRSANTLLRLSPSRSQPHKNWLRQLSAKGKQLKMREEVSVELRRVDGDMQALLRRFNTKWTAAIRLEVAEGSHILKDQGATTQAGIEHLQATLERLSSSVQNSCQGSGTQDELSSQSQAYIGHRIRTFEARFASYTVNGLPAAVSAACSEPEPVPFVLTRGQPQRTAQEVLDLAIDRLVEVIQLIDRADCTLESLFRALLGTASMLCGAQLLDEGLSVITQAADFARLLATQSGSGFARATFVRLLREEAGVLTQLDRIEEAADKAHEALASMSELYILDADVYQADQARCLQIVANTQMKLCHDISAFEASMASVALLRRLQDSPDRAVQAQLRDALNTLSCCQLALCDYDAARTSMTEVVLLERQHFERNPKTSKEKMAHYLANLSRAQCEAGDARAALASIEESLMLFRPAYEARPDRYRQRMAAYLTDMASAQAALGMVPSAVAAIQEAVEIHKTRRALHPGRHTRDLAGSMSQLAEYQYMSSRAMADVLATQQESIAMWREASRQRPSANLRELARSIGRLALYQTSTAALHPASVAIEEALALQGKVESQFPGQCQVRSASISWIAAYHYAEAGDFIQAKLYMEKTTAAVQSHAGACTVIAREMLLRERRFRNLHQEQAADVVLAEFEALNQRYCVQAGGGGTAPSQLDDPLLPKQPSA